MLECDRIDIAQRIDVNKASASKEYDICFYWYFKDLCNGCHYLMQKSMSFNDIAIIYVKGSAYGIHFWYISKDDAISIMSNSNLIGKKGVL